jgi:hypothetical protein
MSGTQNKCHNRIHMASAISDMFKNIYLLQSCPDVLFNILCNHLFIVTLNIYMFDDNRHFASWPLHYNLPLTSEASSRSYSSVRRSCSLIAYFTVLLVYGIFTYFTMLLVSGIFTYFTVILVSGFFYIFYSALSIWNFLHILQCS